MFGMFLTLHVGAQPSISFEQYDALLEVDPKHQQYRIPCILDKCIGLLVEKRSFDLRYVNAAPCYGLRAHSMSPPCAVMPQNDPESKIATCHPEIFDRCNRTTVRIVTDWAVMIVMCWTSAKLVIVGRLGCSRALFDISR